MLPFSLFHESESTIDIHFFKIRNNSFLKKKRSNINLFLNKQNLGSHIVFKMTLHFHVTRVRSNVQNKLWCEGNLGV